MRYGKIKIVPNFEERMEKLGIRVENVEAKVGEQKLQDKERWWVMVERVDNGFLLLCSPCDVEGIVKGKVFEDDESEFGDRRSFKAVVEELIEYFGFIGGRFDRERLKVTLQPGDKYKRRKK